MASQMLIPEPAAEHLQMSDHQSLEVVQIFLNAAIACVAHTRELIPWVSTCFQTRHINQLQIREGSPAGNYNRFCHGPVQEQQDSESQEFRILRSGHDRRADIVLEMIDGGITDALRQGFLDKFQIFIIADTKDPASILETYTFSFAYDDCRVSQVDISPAVFGPFFMRNVHRSFNSSIKSLLRSLRDLPRLPRRRSLGISLLYKDDCPPHYQAPGFHDPKQYRHVPQQGSWSDMWQEDILTPDAEFEVGARKVAINTRSLKFANNMNGAHLQDAKLSAQIQALGKTSSQGQVASTANVLCSYKAASQVREACYGGTDNGDYVDSADESDDRGRVSPSINVPKSLDQIVSATPVISHHMGKSFNSLATLSVAAKNRRRRNVVVSKIAELVVQARAMENNHKGFQRLFDPVQLQSGRIRRLDRSQKTRCECGSQHEDEDMLLCELCGYRQHKVCYGYESLRLGCLPEEHFCYDCLLLPREHQTARSMPERVHMRLALRYLAKQPQSEIEIGQDFLHSVFRDRETPTIEFLKIVDRLTRESYIDQRKDGIVHILSVDKNQLAQAQNTYLDPLSGIAQHYQIIRDGDSFERRKNEVLRALKLYIGDRHFSMNDASNSSYDRVHVKSNTGEEVIRWGFYAKWKKRRLESPHPAVSRKKLSVSDKFVNINRDTPSETSSIGEAMQEAINQSEWDLRLNSRLGSATSGAN